MYGRAGSVTPSTCDSEMTIVDHLFALTVVGERRIESDGREPMTLMARAPDDSR